MSVYVRYLATTQAVLAVGLGFGLSQWRPRHARIFPADRVETQSGSPSALLTAGKILERSEALDLNPRQTERLRALDRQWRAEYGRLHEAVLGASAKFEQFVTDARRRGGVSLQALEQPSSELRQFRIALRERRAERSRRAIVVLTEAQRAKLRPETENPSGGRA